MSGNQPPINTGPSEPPYAYRGVKKATGIGPTPEPSMMRKFLELTLGVPTDLTQMGPADAVMQAGLWGLPGAGMAAKNPAMRGAIKGSINTANDILTPKALQVMEAMGAEAKRHMSQFSAADMKAGGQKYAKSIMDSIPTPPNVDPFDYKELMMKLGMMDRIP